jgi:hypothetical protein
MKVTASSERKCLLVRLANRVHQFFPGGNNEGIITWTGHPRSIDLVKNVKFCQLFPQERSGSTDLLGAEAGPFGFLA